MKDVGIEDGGGEILDNECGGDCLSGDCGGD